MLGVCNIFNVIQMLLLVTILCVGPCQSIIQSTNPACHLQSFEAYRAKENIQKGDIMIGVIMPQRNDILEYFATNNKPGKMFCSYINYEQKKFLIDILYVIQQIKRSTIKLSNQTLGYHIEDSCGDQRVAVKSVFQILSGAMEPVPNYSCMGKRKIAGFIGDLSSRNTITIAQILSIYGYSQISYGATDPSLSDRIRFPYFFRTVEGDQAVFLALVQVIKYFNWTWVGFITSDDLTGFYEHQIFTQYLSSQGICLEYTLYLKQDKVVSNVFKLRDKKIIENSVSSVIVLGGTMFIQFLQVLSQRIASKNLIFLPQWATIYIYYLPMISKDFKKPLLFLPLYPYNIDTPQIIQYYEKILVIRRQKYKLLEFAWMWFLSCLSRDQHKNDYYETSHGTFLHNCSAVEFSLKDAQLEYFLGSPQMHFPVSIMTRAIVNMHLASKKESPEMHIKPIIYRHQIPRSQCSDNCRPGFRKATKPTTLICCYDCVLCSEGEISNITDSEECFRCSDLEWSNENRTHCIAKVEEFLSYTNDVISLVVSTLCILFFLITLLILGVFVSYRDTPIVRANNKNLSFLLLVSIKLSFLSVFLFLGRPVDITCMLGNITFGITFSIAVSSLLAKTIMVCVAFKATKPGSSWRKWVGVKLSNSVVLFCSSIQIIICMTWLAISPPFQELDLHTYPGTIIIQCNEGSAIGFYSVIGYMGLLAAVSFVLAFLARTLPDSFNEAKYITFSMLLFCSVWITMIPAYLSTKGKNTVCVEIFAILTSSAGLLACIFLPKCYTILFRPVMNTIRINQRKTINSV
ncbi:hypothetical protein XELAEV_18004629mg [Xenopus laevis]|uniref:G-protein coupled receptors family 3 profile domain-containing protein n=2 Tax=Xenopus laevis TaxID=8355 RepID=A0A974BRE5_XENLA|nr:hypothetical protein XELAEV_18004629mg [Xenopus laevis]